MDVLVVKPPVEALVHLEACDFRQEGSKPTDRGVASLLILIARGGAFLIGIPVVVIKETGTFLDIYEVVERGKRRPVLLIVGFVVDGIPLVLVRIVSAAVANPTFYVNELQVAVVIHGGSFPDQLHVSRPGIVSRFRAGHKIIAEEGVRHLRALAVVCQETCVQGLISGLQNAKGLLGHQLVTVAPQAESRL